MITRAEILGAFPALTPETRDDGAIAAALSVDRTKLVPTEIGIGLVLETIGLQAGNALLDLIKNTQDFRHVWPLLEQGRLRVDAALVRGTLDALVAASALTAADGEALKNLAVQPDPVTPADVARALEGWQ